MKILGNILWFIFTGLFSGLGYCLAGVVWCITIIGIPFGVQFFKLAGLMFFPFGKKITPKFDEHPIANVIWMIFGGVIAALGFLVVGVLWCITILGIPFGKQCFKLASLTLRPFGARIS